MKFGTRNQPQHASNKHMISMKVPFTNKTMKRRITNLLRRTDLINRVRIWYDAGRNLKRKFHPPKERQRCPPDCGSCKFSVCDKDSCFEKNLIYRVQCSVCERYYIGETSRMIGTRIKEHTSQSNPTSAIVEHFRTEHPGSVIRVGWKILHRNQQQYWKRKSLERHYILSAEGDLINRNDGCDI